jgi:hypothetical protein
MTDERIERAWATPWEDHAVYGVAWETAGGSTGAFAAGTKQDADRIAQELAGKQPSYVKHYSYRMQRAAEAARDYRRGKLLGLDKILNAS